jgi:hypothetical protein
MARSAGAATSIERIVAADQALDAAAFVEVFPRMGRSPSRETRR